MKQPKKIFKKSFLGLVLGVIAALIVGVLPAQAAGAANAAGTACSVVGSKMTLSYQNGVYNMLVCQQTKVGTPSGYSVSQKWVASTEYRPGTSSGFLSSYSNPTMRDTTCKSALKYVRLEVGDTMTATLDCNRPVSAGSSRLNWFRLNLLGTVTSIASNVSTYTLKESDLNSVIYVVAEVDGTSAYKQLTNIKSTYSGTVVPALKDFQCSGKTRILGATAVGSTRQTSLPSCKVAPETVTYRWLSKSTVSSFTAVSTEPTYVLRASDVGKYLSVEIMFRKPGYRSQTFTSNNSGFVTQGTFQPGASVQLIGTVAPGQLLQAKVSAVPAPDSVTFDWLIGADAKTPLAVVQSGTPTYTALDNNSAGQYLFVRATVVKAGLKTVKVTSQGTLIPHERVLPGTSAEIVGNVAVGQAVQAKVTALPTPDWIRYDWLVGTGAERSPLTSVMSGSPTFTPTADLAGKYLYLRTAVIKDGFMTTQVSTKGTLIR